MRKTLAALGATLLLAAGASGAHASHVTPNLGIDVTAVDETTRTVEGIQHCTTPERAGTPATFTVTRDIDFGQFRPGSRWGIAVDSNNVILSTGDMPCTVSGGPGPSGPEGSPPPQDGGAPGFMGGFLNRVWKFHVGIDAATEGKLGVTIERVLNLPKRFASQDDELIDQDAIVLIGSGLRVFRGNERVPLSELKDANEARIQGKLLPPQKWANDEDDQPVPTIRAKKAFLAP